MATRGCIIELKKDVCKIGYLHYGAGSLPNLSRKNILTPNIWKESLNWIESLINAMDIREYSTKK